MRRVLQSATMIRTKVRLDFDEYLTDAGTALGSISS